MTLTIGKVAKKLAINIETIRFYEKKGLINQPIKPEVGYRIYPEETIERITFIKNAQKLGFTLKEIQQLLLVNDQPCHQVESIARFKLKSVKEKISQLQSLQRALQTLVTQCESNQDDTICPIIDTLQPPKS